MDGVQSKAERMAMIREAHKKFLAKQAKKAKAPKVVDEEDERLWSDAPRYAAEHYGETFHETTKYDDDWG